MATVKQSLKVFRWGGLIPFALVFGGLWLGGYLFADTIARHLLQSNLTRMQGAQVDVESASVAWQPFGVVADGLAFTDRGEPGQNALDIERVSVQMDGLALLTGKIVFESLAVDGLRFNTQRDQPGRIVERAPRPEREGPSAAQHVADTVDLPSPGEALSRHGPLRLEARAQEASASRDDAVAKVRSRQAELPSEQRLNEHRERLQRLQGQSFNSLDAVRSARADIETLTRDVTRDRQSINEFIDTVESSQADIRDALRAVAGAPAEDIADILATYNLSADGQVALAGLLLGDQWADWIVDAQSWYATAEPWIERLIEHRSNRAARDRGVTGHYVLFPEASPTPRFWLKEARINAHTDGGDWLARLSNLSSNAAMIDRPANLAVRSTRLDAAEEAQIDAQWDRRDGNRMTMTMAVTDWRVSGWQVPDDDLPIGLRSANTQLAVDAVYDRGWEGRMDWAFTDSRFGMPQSWGSGNLLRQALSTVDRFDVRADLSGAGLLPRTRWTSDLDNRVGAAVRASVDAQVDAWEAELRAELRQRQTALEAPVRAELARLDDERRAWEGRKTELENEVLATLESLDQQLADQRRSIERRLEQERREAERRARDELENRARDALGF